MLTSALLPSEKMPVAAKVSCWAEFRVIDGFAGDSETNQSVYTISARSNILFTIVNTEIHANN